MTATIHTLSGTDPTAYAMKEVKEGKLLFMVVDKFGQTCQMELTATDLNEIQILLNAYPKSAA